MWLAQGGCPFIPLPVASMRPVARLRGLWCILLDHGRLTSHAISVQLRAVALKKQGQLDTGATPTTAEGDAAESRTGADLEQAATETAAAEAAPARVPSDSTRVTLV